MIYYSYWIISNCNINFKLINYVRYCSFNVINSTQNVLMKSIKHRENEKYFVAIVIAYLLY